MSARTAVYPGTFDPITKGHMDVIGRAAKVADRLVIAIVEIPAKPALFTFEQRIELVRSEVGPLQRRGPEIDVRPLRGLLMRFAEEVGASFVIRGLRAVSDFDYELQMANMNARLSPAVETVFLMAAEGNQFIASSLVREIARLGGDVSTLVSEPVAKRLAARILDPQL